MAIYKLSRTADTDFESIFIYGVLTFGLQQADSYAQGMQARFEQLAQKPYLYPAIDHIRQGLVSITATLFIITSTVTRLLLVVFYAARM